MFAFTVPRLLGVVHPALCLCCARTWALLECSLRGPCTCRSPRSRKGESYEKKKRRRGRPAWTRSPDDSPLRDGNRCSAL